MSDEVLCACGKPAACSGLYQGTKCNKKKDCEPVLALCEDSVDKPCCNDCCIHRFGENDAHCHKLKKSTKPKRIPISAAERIAKDYGYDQVVVVARKVGEDGIEHVTTYGINKAHCDSAAKQGDAIKRLMGWPVDKTERET